MSSKSLRTKSPKSFFIFNILLLIANNLANIRSIFSSEIGSSRSKVEEIDPTILLPIPGREIY